MIGSSLIIIHLFRKCRRGEGLKSVDFLLLSISMVDVLASFGYFLGSWPMPPGPSFQQKRPERLWATGTDATCTAQATVVQFGITVIFLNVILCLHYLLVVRYRWQEDRLRKWTLPGIASALAVGLSLSISPIFLDAYGPLLTLCWFGLDIPTCVAETGQTPTECVEHVWRMRDLFYFTPLWICVGLATLLQFALFCTVRNTEAKGNKWRVSTRVKSIQNSSHLQGTTAMTSSSIKSAVDFFGTSANNTPMGSQKMDKKRLIQQWREMRQQRSSRERSKRQLLSRSRLVAVQSLLYVGCFYVCWVPFILATIVLKRNPEIMTTPGVSFLETTFFWGILIAFTMQPLQGFLNCLVYFRVRIIAGLMKLCRLRGCFRKCHDRSCCKPSGIESGADVDVEACAVANDSTSASAQGPPAEGTSEEEPPSSCSAEEEDPSSSFSSLPLEDHDHYNDEEEEGTGTPLEENSNGVLSDDTQENPHRLEQVE